jgi:hypothetical protein
LLPINAHLGTYPTRLIALMSELACSHHFSEY